MIYARYQRRHLTGQQRAPVLTKRAGKRRGSTVLAGNSLHRGVASGARRRRRPREQRSNRKKGCICARQQCVCVLVCLSRLSLGAPIYSVSPLFLPVRSIPRRDTPPAQAWFTLPQPNLQAGQKITGFNLKVGLDSSTLGMNNPPVNPALLGRLVPANPFAMPPPDCTKKGAPCVAVPDTLDGVDPNQKNKAVVGEFNFDQASASVKLGANANVAGDPNNKKAPHCGDHAAHGQCEPAMGRQRQR